MSLVYFFAILVYMENAAKTILLVEDDETLRDMYTLKIEAEGYKLLTAADGEVGLALALANHPDVILLDIMMPKMDGFAVLTELKKDEAFKQTPILMLSNLGQQADVDKGKQLGANDYVVKASMTPTQVVAKIKSYLK